MSRIKQQFAQIQLSKLTGVPQQESPSEEQLSVEETQTRATLPPQHSAQSNSPASYWDREDPAAETQQAPYNPMSRAVPPQGYNASAGQVPPVAPNSAWPYTPSINQPPVQQLPATQSQNRAPLVLPSPERTRPPYSPPMQPPAGQPPVAGPMLQNNAARAMPPPYGPPMQPGYGPPMQQPYGPPMQPGYGPPMPPQGRYGKTAYNKRRFPIWARVVVAVTAVLLVGGGTAFGYYQANFANPLGKITGQQAAQIGTNGQSTSQGAATNGTMGSQRINILLLGSDNDGKNSSPLAQTDIVITIDPQTQYVGMLSIPRDLRVVIPNQGTGKMDAAFSLGWQSNLGGATPLSNAAGLSIATVEKNFGIHIDHYAWVGLDGFVKVIDTAGGVDIDGTHPITDNAYPNDVNTTDHFGYKRLYIAPGPQHMNGVQALEYVRTRHADLVGDFGRSARQQQVLSQLKTKLDTTSIISKLPALANDLGDTVKTDMAVQDIVNFMNFARNINTTKIDRVILSPPYSSLAPDATGDFLPNCSLITAKIAQMFNLGNNVNCISTASIHTGNTAIAANQPRISTATSALSTMALSSSVSTAAQILSQPIQRNEENITGVHSLLDLMFLVVFNSLDATKV